MNETKPYKRSWWRWPGRYRHTRGFGVHSPLAYRVVTEVINGGNTGYYTVDEEDLPDGMTREDYRCIVGLVCLLRPTAILTGNKTLDLAITTRVDSTITPGSSEPDMIVALPGRLPHPNLLSDCFKRGGTVVIIDRLDCREESAAMLRAMDHGISLAGKHMIIAIGRRDLPRQHFELLI